MKPNETSLNLQVEESKMRAETMGDDHVGTSFETPLRPDAFERDDDLKIELIEKHFREIMLILGLDLEDDSLSGTPFRVAKMYVKEIFSGLNPENKPDIKLFDNKYKYGEMLVEKEILFHSFCEHHFLPIIGKAHVAYISSGKVVGLSKINRVVHHFARRPQVQERMTMQIAAELREALGTDDIAVLVEAEHLCVSSRGVQDQGSITVTSSYSGKFQDEAVRNQFLTYVKG
ncbi:MAG: GTP cyclohydrolase I FolE [Bacteroidia bacterium]|nr:GTP cyclohydrolase I FolE [Bacteroidia bacterium]